MNFRKQDLRFFLLLFIGVCDLIFVISLFMPILDDEGDLKNWTTLLIEGGLFLPVAYYVARYFFEKELNIKGREQQAYEIEIEYKSRLVSPKLFELQNKFPNDTNIHNFIDILTDLTRISEIFSVAFPLNDEGKNSIENSYNFLNQARVDFQSAKKDEKKCNENIDLSIKSLISFGKIIDLNLDPDNNFRKDDSFIEFRKVDF